MKVLITGASGFLGRYTVASAMAAGHEVRALVRPGTTLPAGWPAEVEVMRGDVGDLASLTAAVAGQDAVAHLAAMVGGGDADQFAVTVAGTERLLTALEGSMVSRVVLASSLSVYDWGAPTRVLDESTPIERRWWRRDGYAASKVWQERIVREAAEVAPWDLVVLRPGFIWGPEKPDCPGVGEVVGSRMIVIGWRTPLPLTWVENCADAFVLALTAKVPDGTTVNVVDDDIITTRQYAAASTRALGQSSRVVVPYAVARAVSQLAWGTSRRLFPEQGGRLPSVLDPAKFEARFRPLRFPNDRAKLLLGWSPRVSWRQASARIFQRA